MFGKLEPQQMLSGFVSFVFIGKRMEIFKNTRNERRSWKTSGNVVSPGIHSFSCCFPLSCFPTSLHFRRLFLVTSPRATSVRRRKTFFSCLLWAYTYFHLNSVNTAKRSPGTNHYTQAIPQYTQGLFKNSALPYQLYGITVTTRSHIKWTTWMMQLAPTLTTFVAMTHIPIVYWQATKGESAKVEHN